MKAAARGLIWIVIGAAVWIYGAATGTDIVVRGTQVPWGGVVIGVGALLMAWDLVRASRQKP